MKNKLNDNKDLFNERNDIIKDYIKQHIKIVSPSEEIVLPASTYYLPHKAAVKENREKIVFDRSACSPNKPSINDFLFSGPCLLPLVFDILIRFRTKKIGIVSDVKQAFHQIEIVKEHCDYPQIL